MSRFHSYTQVTESWTSINPMRGKLGDRTQSRGGQTHRLPSVDALLRPPHAVAHRVINQHIAQAIFQKPHQKHIRVALSQRRGLALVEEGFAAPELRGDHSRKISIHPQHPQHPHSHRQIQPLLQHRQPRAGLQRLGVGGQFGAVRLGQCFVAGAAAGAGGFQGHFDQAGAVGPALLAPVAEGLELGLHGGLGDGVGHAPLAQGVRHLGRLQSARGGGAGNAQVQGGAQRCHVGLAGQGDAHAHCGGLGHGEGSAVGVD